MRSNNVHFVSIVVLCIIIFEDQKSRLSWKNRRVVSTLFTQFSPQAGRLSSFLASATSCDVAINNGRKISFPQS